MRTHFSSRKVYSQWDYACFKCNLKYAYLKRLRDYFLKEEVDSQHKGKNKRIIANPTLEGLIFTARNFVCLAKHLLQNGSSKVCLKTFSQDVLEAFFGNVVSQRIYLLRDLS